MTRKTKSTQASVVLWRGVTPDGRGKVTLWAVPEGGNTATGPTIDLYVAADDLVDGCDPAERLTAHSNRARIVDRIDHRSAAAAGCAAACPHLRAKSTRRTLSPTASTCCQPSATMRDCPTHRPTPEAAAFARSSKEEKSPTGEKRSESKAKSAGWSLATR